MGESRSVENIEGNVLIFGADLEDHSALSRAMKLFFNNYEIRGSSSLLVDRLLDDDSIVTVSPDGPGEIYEIAPKRKDRAGIFEYYGNDKVALRIGKYSYHIFLKNRKSNGI